MKSTYYLLLALLYSFPVHSTCDKPQSLFEDKDCQRMELERADHNVLVAYQQASKRIMDKADNQINANKTMLAMKAGQAAWRNFRDKDCNVLSELYAGMNNASQNVLGCKIEHAKIRIKQLNEFNP